MVDSLVFGMSLCYSSLVKEYNSKVSKKSNKIKKIILDTLEYMVSKYSVEVNGVPLSIV
jgi:hypothetical protein